MDETDEAAGRGSEAEKPPGADLPSIARGDTPGHSKFESGVKAGKFHEILKAGLKLHCNYTVITLHL